MTGKTRTPIPFHSSEQSTLGIEWEVALVDRATGALVPAAEEVMDLLSRRHPHLVDPEGLQPHVTGEFLANTVEMVTGICHSVPEALGQLDQLVTSLREVADELGVDVYSAGTHPFSRSVDQLVSDKDRYHKVLERAQYWGRQMVIYGIHVHVGVDSRDKALPVMDELLNYYPHLLALSANSPYWNGEDTGYASQRALLFQQLPTAGLPFQFQDWSGFEDYVQDMITTGVIEEESENRWDIRPVSKYGTVEMRVCDGVSTLQEIGALAALTQCLVERASRRLEAGESIPSMPPWHQQENKWRAARYGAEAIIIQDADSHERLVTDDLRDLVEDLAPVAADLGCTEQLQEVGRIIDRGPGYLRQRRVAEENDGDLAAVAHDLTALTRTGYQD